MNYGVAEKYRKTAEYNEEPVYLAIESPLSDFR